MMKCPYTPHEMAARLALFHGGIRPAIGAVAAFEECSAVTQGDMKPNAVELAFHDQVSDALVALQWAKQAKLRPLGRVVA